MGALKVDYHPDSDGDADQRKGLGGLAQVKAAQGLF